MSEASGGYPRHLVMSNQSQRRMALYRAGMASFTSIDLTDFDLARAAQSTLKTTDSVALRTAGLAIDVTYITIGLGLLSFQRVQVKRREIERALRR